MNANSKIGLDVLKAALVLGLLGDVLLPSTPWGLNVLLFNVAFVFGFAVLLWRGSPERITTSTVALMAAQVFFAAMFVWRDSIELRVADTFAILAILSIQLLPRLGVTQRLAGAFHLVIGFVWASLSALLAPAALLMSDVEWSQLPSSGWRKHTFAVLRGVAIATPLVLVFGGLFVAADAAYEGMVTRALNIDFSSIFSHGILICVFSWLSMGYLRGALINPLGAAIPVPDDKNASTGVLERTTFKDVAAETGEPPVTLPDDRTVVEHLNISDPSNVADTEPRPAQSSHSEAATPKPGWTWSSLSNSVLPPAFALGTTEVAVILGLMNLLFLSFVFVQVRYLFGGFELVQNTLDFKLADYARRGFGELVTVSALVLPTLLIGQWLIRKEASRAQLLFKILAGTQIALLFVIMASAIQRLLVLMGPLGYGMTTVRLYPMIFMGWLAVVFIWFGATVLRGARQYFAWGALWSAFVVLGATHGLNPDAFIVRSNIQLMQQGREYDAFYNSRLSDDALPAVLESFSAMNRDDKMTTMRSIADRYCEANDETDLRGWNMSRRNALEAINSRPEWTDAIGTCGVMQFPGPEVDRLLDR